MASVPISFQKQADGRGIGVQILLQVPHLLLFNLSMLFKSLTRHIGTKFIFGTSLMDSEVSRVIYVDFLPRALAEGRYVAAPEPYVIGKGLDSIQAGLDVQMNGVSASKVVVSL